MSSDEVIEFKKLARGWNWEARIAALVSFVTVVFFVATFYFNTNNTDEKHDRELREINDKLVKLETTLHSKVGMEQFEDFRQDVHSDMKEIKALVIKLYEQRGN